MTFDVIEAQDGKSAILQVNGVNVGDRLTNNAYADDGYRFHDVFHLALYAILGWSSVLRRMLKRKRKSRPKIDEVEDGARAAIVEELVVNKIYNYARDHGFLSQSDGVYLGLLKSVSSLVRDLEVSDCAAWEWRLAVVEGCRVFRDLCSQGSGKIEIDVDTAVP